MNTIFRSVAPVVAIFGAVALTGCGSEEAASGSLNTMVAVGPRAYATIPPVSAPATTAPIVQPKPGDVTTVEVVHVVEAGESLAVIANAYTIGTDELLNRNGFESLDVVINPGDRIVIPVGATMPLEDVAVDSGDTATGEATDTNGDQAVAAEPEADNSGEDNTASAASEESSEGDGCVYEILASDSGGPAAVARKVGVSTEALLKANESSGVLDNFLIGGKLIIPPPGRC